MGALELESLEIRNYRVFSHFTISRLGRVNLIAGNNNVGKSCLLEALWLYARHGDPAVVWHILASRDEISHHPAAIGEAVAERTNGIRYLFHGRRHVDELTEPIEIGEIDNPDKRLALGVGWYVAHMSSNGGDRTLERIAPSAVAKADHPTLRLTAQMGQQPTSSFLFSADLFRGKPSLVYDCLACVSLLTNPVDTARTGSLWDAVAGTEREADVVQALRFIMPMVESLSIPDDPEGRVRHAGHLHERIPHVKLADVAEPVPIRTLGQGMTRVLAIVLALVNAKDGFLLVDELESSLHLAVQANLWRLIFRLARKLNVQVFATAHSWDCFEAFQQAASEDEQYEEGLLIVLRRDGEQITSTLFEGEEMATVPREQVLI